MYKKKRLNAQLTAYLLSFTLAFSAAGGGTALASEPDERGTVDATLTLETAAETERGEESAQDTGEAQSTDVSQQAETTAQETPAAETAQTGPAASGETDGRGNEQAASDTAETNTPENAAAEMQQPEAASSAEQAQETPRAAAAVSNDYEIDVDGSAVTAIPQTGALSEIAPALGGDSVTLTDAATGLRVKLTDSDSASGVLNALKTGTYLTVSSGETDLARYLVSVSGNTVSLSTCSGPLVQLAFDENGGSLEGNGLSTVFAGDAISMTPAAARSGYQFAGWFYGPEETAARAYETDAVNDGTTLYAHWTEGSVNTVTYHFGYTPSGTVQDYTLAEPYAAQDGVYSVGRFPSLNVYGYVISAWADASGQAISGTQMSGDLSVTGSWEYGASPATSEEPATAPQQVTMALNEMSASNEANLLQAAPYTVTVTIGEDADPAESVSVSITEDPYTLADVKEALEADTSITWPDADTPTRDGYTFTGWQYEIDSTTYTATDLTDETTKFSDDVTLTAQWEEDVDESEEESSSQVTVVCGSDENTLYVGSESQGTTGTGILETLTAASAYFDDAQTDFSSAKADYLTNQTVTDEDGDTYNAVTRIPISTDAAAASALESASAKGILILYNDTAEIMRLSITKAADSTYVIEKISTDDYDLYKVTYDANYSGAAAITAVGYRTEDEVLSYFDADDPTRDGYTFSGWYYDAAAEDEAQVEDYIDSNTTLYAGWISSAAYNVVYNMNDASYSGESSDTTYTFKTAVYGTNAQNGSEIDPTLYADTGDEEPLFIGWYTAKTDGTNVTGQEYTSSVTTVYARWADELDVYFYDDDEEIFYYLDPVFGADGYTLAQVYGDDYELPTPNDRAGYAFTGWYTSATGGTQVTEDTTLTSSMADEDDSINLYARWYRGTFTITYNPNGGEFSDGTTASKTASVQSGESLGSLPYVTREGYNLKGWFDEDGNEVLSDTMPSANTTYTAQWEKRPAVVATINLPSESLDASSASDLDTLYQDFTYTPTDATNATFVWTTSDSSIIAISDTSAKDKSSWASGSSPFTIREDGTVDITITTADGTISDTCTVTLKKTVSVTNIDLYRNSTENVTGTTIEVKMNEALNLSTVFTPADADDGTDGTWTSSNPDVITITEDGEGITCKGVGTTVLTFTNSDGVSASVTVVVKDDDKINEEQSVQTLAFVVPGTETVHMGDSINLNIVYTPLVNVHNASFVWESDNKEVLTVDSDGLPPTYHYGGSTGTAHITVATADGTIYAVKTIVVVEKDSVDWTPDKKTYYTVSFETFGGSELPDETVEAFNSAVLPTPAKEGYLFDGWYLDNSFSSDPVTTLVPTADTILYAHWVEDPNKANTYTITFEPQNGEKATIISYREGSMLGSFPEVAREGFRLAGWFTADEGGEEVTTSTLVTANTAYYAHWIDMAKEGMYVLTLDPNGGILDDSASPAIMQPDLVVGAGYWNDVSSEIPTMQGHSFMGYYDAREGGTMVYDETGACVKGTAYFDEDGNFKGSADLNVFAHWEKTVEKFVLTFDYRDGSSTPDEVIYDYNETATDFPTPTREGWTFLGWFERATAGTAITSILMDGNKTIYAQWEKNPSEPVTKDSYTVTFDSQGGSIIDPVTVTPGESVELETPTREGYTFLGWFDAPTTGNHVTSPATPDDDINLYAHWSKDKVVVSTFSVTFDYQDGTTDTVTGSVYDDNSADTIASFPAAEKDRAEFLGWYTAPTGGVRVRTYSGKEDITLYAQFTADESGSETPATKDSYTITFDSQGGTAVDSVTKEEGTIVKSFASPTRDGYTFLGWYTASDAGNLVSSIIVKKDVTLYAQWAVESAKTYTVILNKQDGTSSTTKTLNVGETFIFPSATRSGYTFLGWYTSPTGGTLTTIYSGTAGSTTTFYGQWSAATTEKVHVKSITLSKHETSITKGQVLDLTYTYTPKNASNASFTWTSSNPDVIAIVTKSSSGGGTTQSLKVKSAGETTLTVSTTDGTVKDSCKVTVKETSGSSTQSGSTSGASTPTSSGTTDTSSASSGSSSSGASTPTSSGTTADTSESTSESAEKYTLTVVSTSGSASKVTVKNTVTLDALTTKLGYTVSSYGLKTATNTTEAALDKNTTMASLASTGSSGDMLIIAYNESGSAMGSAKVEKTATDAFTVTLSKGTTATLKKYTNGTSDSTTTLSGKSATSTTAGTSGGAAATADGKGGAAVVANPSQTGDPMRYAGALTLLLCGIFLALYAARKRKEG